MTTDIAADGDLVLIVGEGEGQGRIRVHSLMLKNASPVFAAMLGPHFAEGHQLGQARQGTPAEVKLPEDDPEAMVLLCSVLHATAPPPEPIGASMIVEIASLADKYNLIEALSFAMAVWLAETPVNATPSELWHLLLASLLLEDARAYQRISRRLILGYSGSFYRLGAENYVTSDVSMFEAAAALEEARTATRSDILDRTLQHIRSLADNCEPEQKERSLRKSITLLLGEVMRSPFTTADLRKMSLDDLLRQLKQRGSYGDSPSSRKRPLKLGPHTFRDVAQLAMEEVYVDLAGLCFHCHKRKRGKVVWLKHDCGPKKTHT